ncbi:MAG: AAA family ATPase [Actinomycetota bacterium]|nr:AAA family ATPase [Actinomycetota bacterium]
MLRRIARDEASKAVKRLHPVIDNSSVRAIAKQEAERAVAAQSPTNVMRCIAREEAATVAAAEVAHRLAGLAESQVSAEVWDTLAHVARREAAKAVPRLVQVSVNGSAPTSVDGDTHAVLPDLLLALTAGCHVFLVGPAGTGKSTMARQAAQALSLEFFALSMGPTTPTSKLFGYLDAGGSYHPTPLRRAYEHGGLMLMDELDNGHPGLLTELNQALALDVCAFPDGMVARLDRFRLVATGNTYGLGGDRQYVGRQALDAATLDRLVTIDVAVDEALETRLTLAHAPTKREQAKRILARVRQLRRVASDKKIPVIFSPRACINAARLLEAGASMADATQWCVTRGLSSAHRTALGLKP